MKFIYQECGIPEVALQKTVERLRPEIERAQQYAFAKIPHDAVMLQEIKAAVVAKQTLKPTALVLVGIGGSSLGTLAIYQALQSNSFCKLYCFDTIEQSYTQELLALVEAEFKHGGSVLMVIVSKSGKTTETLVNAALLFEMFKRYYKNYDEHIVLITDHNSPLAHLGQQEHMLTLSIPHDLGGRFSVFSAVGLFPLGILGVDIEALLSGARAPLADAALSAAILYEQYKAGKHIHDTFLFTPALQSLGAWYRQLMGESIGKRYNRAGAEVHVGITPTVSMGTNDLHSVAQLYLAGPYDKITTFVGIEDGENSLTIPDNLFSQLGTMGAEQQVAVIHQALFEGTRIAYAKANRPYMTLMLKNLSSFYLGQFLQFKMYEIVYLGFLLNINVFDQPEVELYKSAARDLMKK